MNSSPVVSLVTPAFNLASYLGQATDSVLAQDYPNIDYLVIDDGSTDDTPMVLERYAGQVRTYRHQNMGQAQTLNQGWNAATGRYLAYLSADDILEPNCISAMVQALEADEGVVCAYPNSDLIDSYGTVIKRAVCAPFDLERTVVDQECRIGPGAVFRRSAFLEVGGWNPTYKLAPDRDFWIRLSSKGRFHFDERPLAKYRLHTGATSYREVSDAATKEYLDVLDAFFASERARDLLPRKDEAYAKAHIVRARNAFRSGAFAAGLRHYRTAQQLHPPLRGLSLKAALVRTVVSKPVRMAASRFRWIGSRKA